MSEFQTIISKMIDNVLVGGSLTHAVAMSFVRYLPFYIGFCLLVAVFYHVRKRRKK